MCVEIFAPGRPVTIDYLHERIYFTFDHAVLSAYLVCEAFIHNDFTPPRHGGGGDRGHIERLRVQLPHYIDWAQPPGAESYIEAVEWTAIPDELTWHGEYTRDDGDHRVICLDADSQPRNGGYTYPPRAVYRGQEVEAHFAVPREIERGRRAEFGQAMRRHDATILDLNLDPPLPPGKTAYIRLNIKPLDWPRRQVVPMPGTLAPADAQAFVARLAIRSPGLLRDDLATDLDGWLHLELVQKGWRLDNTLLRIREHRISLVFPEDVFLGRLVTTSRSVFALEPFTLEPEEDERSPGRRFVQPFLAGSSCNADADLVSTAKRIRDYIVTLPGQSGLGTPAPAPAPNARSMFDLVCKFGGSKQEAVGTLLRSMVTHNLLREVTPAAVVSKLQVQRTPELEDQRVYQPTESLEWRHALLSLRHEYTFPDDDAPARHMGLFSDLHPFSISFDVHWQRRSAKQEAFHARLGHLAADPLAAHAFSRPALRRAPRAAGVIVCSECGIPSLGKYPGLVETGRHLVSVLRALGQFDAELLVNPGSDAEFQEFVTRRLETVGGESEGLFLLWYLGHARAVGQTPAHDDVEFLHTGSQTRGVRWDAISQQLQRHPHLPKAVVLNACQSGVVYKRQPPSNTFVWATARAADLDPVHLVSTEEHKSFTSCFIDTVLEGLGSTTSRPSERDPLPLPELLERTHEALGTKVVYTGGHRSAEFSAENLGEFCHNLYRYDVLPVPMRNRMAAQIRQWDGAQ